VRHRTSLACRGENRLANLALVERLRPIADNRGISVAQLALAWVLAQGAEHNDIVAVVGAGRPERVADNLVAARTKLTDVDLAEIGRAVPPSSVAGDRYAAPLMAMLDSGH
jgi:aryl-alcohol dehydrogenase-like predicted oxidoreductase